ncbi:MAG: carbohydrate ABC transporter permease [Chloroflexi bacterium]|nr:carbohydrate ABC transporter permease [Chloroflexota bacterium]MBV9544199.1 carbohydrate ABC transporter permease [Chloroflexota bacterium]
MRLSYLTSRFGLHAIAILLGIVLMVPFYWAIISSLKQMNEVREIPIVWWPRVVQWRNYLDVWGVRFFPNWVRNSIFLTLVATSGTLLSSSLAGYAFARFRFPGKNILFSITLATLMLPGYVLLIPNYMLFWQLGWLNTYLPLTVPYWFGSAFFIFLFRQFFMTVPVELDDAARIDGAGYPRIFWSIMLPLSGPVFGAAAIIEGINQWNSFLRPLIILNNPDNFPLSVGIRYFVVNPGDNLPKDHLLMAASVMMTLPIIILFFVGQRSFVRGVVMSGIKG